MTSSALLDLPAPELAAAVLDGELYRLGDGYRPIDVRTDAAGRAAAVLAGLPTRVIAERASAAWIWGALLEQPAVRTCCVSLRERARPAPQPTLHVREVVVAPPELRRLRGRLVTSPRRTLVDLARWDGAWDPASAGALCRLDALDPAEVADSLRALPRLPGGRRARVRLRSLAAELSRC